MVTSSLVVDFVLSKIVEAHQCLEVSYGLGAHAVSYEVNFSLAAPSSWNAVGICDKLIACNLPEQPWLIEFLLLVLLAIMPMSINRPHQVSSIIIYAYPSRLFDGIYTNQLLVKLTGSVMKASKWANNSHIYVTIWLHTRLEGVQEIITHQMSLIRRTASKSMHQNNGEIVPPQFFWQVPIPTIHRLYFLKFIESHGHLVDQIRDKNQKDNMSIFRKCAPC